MQRNATHNAPSVAAGASARARGWPLRLAVSGSVSRGLVRSAERTYCSSELATKSHLLPVGPAPPLAAGGWMSAAKKRASMVGGARGGRPEGSSSPSLPPAAAGWSRPTSPLRFTPTSTSGASHARCTMFRRSAAPSGSSSSTVAGSSFTSRTRQGSALMASPDGARSSTSWPALRKYGSMGLNGGSGAAVVGFDDS